MKKSCILLLLLSLLLTACQSDADKHLAAIVADANAECPQRLDADVVMSGFDYDSRAKMVYIRLENAESLVTVDVLRKAEDAQRIYFSEFLTSSGSDILDALNAAKAELTIVVRGMNTGEKEEILFSRSDLMSLAETEKAADSERRRLDAIIGITNAQCPLPVAGQSLVLEELTIDSTVLVYHYSTDSAMARHLLSYGDTLKRVLLPSLCEDFTSPTGTEQLGLLKECNISILYRFTGPDSLNINIPFSLSDIK